MKLSVVHVIRKLIINYSCSNLLEDQDIRFQTQAKPWPCAILSLSLVRVM